MKQRVINFMKLKNDLLEGKLYDEEDFNEILQWNDSTSEQVAELIENYLINSVDFGKSLTDERLCPQCQYYISCHACDYGERHGICDSRKPNTYTDLLDSNNANSLMEIMYSKNNDFVISLLNAIASKDDN